jgi:hypothetical protein
LSHLELGKCPLDGILILIRWRHGHRAWGFGHDRKSLAP